jgi:LysM repeat protein
VTLIVAGIFSIFAYSMHPINLTHTLNRPHCISNREPFIIKPAAGRLSLLTLFLFFSLLPQPCLGINQATVSDGIDTFSLRTKDPLTVQAIPSDQISPIQGKVISPFGYRGRRKHTGADIKLHKGDTVRVACCGVVTMAQYYYGYGNLVVVKHDNRMETYYSHLDKCLVHTGDTISTGKPVGLGGRTGRATTDHLHFEVRRNKKPLNPEKYFDFCNGCVRKALLPGIDITDEEDRADASEPSTSKATETPTVKSMEVSPAKPEVPTTKRMDSLLAQNNPKTAVGISKDQVDPNAVFITDAQNAEARTTADYVIIQKGDTLYSLAKRHGTTVQQLQELNQLEGTLLKIGQKLKIK